MNELRDNNQKSQSLHINFPNEERNLPTIKESFYGCYAENLRSEMNYLTAIEKDLCVMIKSYTERAQMEINEHDDLAQFSSCERQINICENYECEDGYNPLAKGREIFSENELEQGYKSGPCFSSQNRNFNEEANYSRRNSIENERNNPFKRSFVNNAIYPITTTINLDLEKKKKSSERNHSNNRSNIVSSSPQKKQLNINYLKKIKFVK